MTPAGATLTSVGQWSSAGGPYGGPVRDLAVSPSDPNQLLAGTRRGLFRSTDGAATWSWSSAGIVPADVWFVAFHPTDPSVAYATTTQGFFRSTDGGASWSASLPGASGGIATSPASPDRIVTVNRGSLWISDDAGLSWRSIFPQQPEGKVLPSFASSPTDGDVIYLLQKRLDGTEAWLHRSDDGGTNWNSTAPVTPSAGGLKVHPADPDRVYLGAKWSDDNGLTWHDLETPSPATSVTFTSSAEWLATTNSGMLFRSDSAGVTWDTGQQLPEWHTGIVGVAGDSQRLWAYGWLGVRSSEDGGATFVDSNHGLTGAAARRIAIDPQDPATIFAFMEFGTLHRSFDGGLTWERIDERWKLGAIRGIAVGGGSLYVWGTRAPYGSDWFLERSYDGGDTWEVSGDPNVDVSPIRGIAAHPTEPGVALALLGWHGEDYVPGIYRTQDGGLSWNLVLEGSTDEIDALGDRVYVRFAQGYEQETRSRRLAVSDDFGVSWELSPSLGSPIHAVAITSSPDDLHVFVGGAVARSRDAGMTWEHTPRFLSLPWYAHISDLAVDPIDSTQLFIATLGAGVWMSMDSGSHWNQITPSDQEDVAYAVVFPPSAAAPAGTSMGIVSSTASSSGSGAGRPALTGTDRRGRGGLWQMVPRPHPRNGKIGITGRPRLRQLLRCRPRMWSRTVQKKVSWFRDGRRLRRTQLTYRVRAIDRGRRIRCAVTGFGPGGKRTVSSARLRIR